MSTLRDRLFNEILLARKRVYSVAPPTPLEEIALPIDTTVLLKREDLSPIHAYKWRGAYNHMAQLSPEAYRKGVVCASAGNHAQGVALGAKLLGTHAVIFMPVSTPGMKQRAVLRHGGQHVEVRLVGDNFDVACEAATEFALESDRTIVHPYDDLLIMGGQGTLADEIVMSGKGPFDVAYLQIGGGGMAAAVACWLKAYYPDIHLVGVEGVQQASMAAAIEAGGPVTLPYLDVFCDGTAVKRAGDLTYTLCAELIDEFITVTNEEVSAAIALLWETARCIPEPAGAMGVAGVMKQADTLRNKKALAILCGANVDFERLAWIANHAGIGAARRRYYRFQMPETPGGLRHLLDHIFEGVNIIEVQYGKVDNSLGWPIIGFEASPDALARMEHRLIQDEVPHEDVTLREDVEFRIINYEPELFHSPCFLTLEFPERAGALREFLGSIGDTANICYFNYVYSGEQVGRALIGFEFPDEENRHTFKQALAASRHDYREVSHTVLERIL